MMKTTDLEIVLACYLLENNKVFIKDSEGLFFNQEFASSLIQKNKIVAKMKETR